MNIREKDKKFLGRTSKTRNLLVAGAKGDFVYDEQGRKYIDFFTGWCVGNVGWGVPEIEKEIKNFQGPVYVSPGYFYKPWAELADILAKITPGKLVKSFRATGGTEAVEIALQAAMAHTGRSEFISIEGSYHGHSIGAMSIGETGFRKLYKNLLPNCHKISPPLDAEAGKNVEKILSKRQVAAFISEPIICNVGVEIPTREFFEIVQRACKKYGSLFIIDEVATGFGRTGKMFASEHYELKPDIMCLAKGLTGGYGALGATIMTEMVARSLRSFYSTFGWQPLNVHATLANLKYLLKNKNTLFANAKKMETYFQTRLEKMKFKSPARVRAKGLAIGVEFSKPGYGAKIIAAALKKGLLLADVGSNTVGIFPQLNISQKPAKQGLDILENSI